MANSKFSGVGFTSGVTATDNSVFAGYEVIGPGQGENRRWTSKELFTGTYNLNGGGLKFFFTNSQQCRFNHNGFDATGSGSVNATQNIVINADTGNTGQNISLRLNGSEKMSITNGDTTHANAVKFNGGIKDTNNQLGSSGQVLSSTGSTVEWINAGGSIPTLQDVVDQDNILSNNNATGLITFRDGNILSTLDFGFAVGFNRFDIRTTNGINDILIKPGGFKKLILAGGQAQVGNPDSRSLVIDTPPAPPAGVTGTITMGNSMLTEVEGPIKIFKDLQDRNGDIGDSGDVLVSYDDGFGTNGVEWKSPSTLQTSTATVDATNADVIIYEDTKIRLFYDVSTTDDIDLRIKNVSGTGSTASVYHVNYTNFDTSTTDTTTVDLNAQGNNSDATLDFDFTSDERMELVIWAPDPSLLPASFNGSFPLYRITILNSSSLYTNSPVLCNVQVINDITY